MHLDEVLIGGPVGTAVGRKFLLRPEEVEEQQTDDETAETVGRDRREQFRHVRVIPDVPDDEIPGRINVRCADGKGTTKEDRVVGDEGGEFLRRHPEAADGRQHGHEEEGESIHRTHPGSGPG